MASTTAPTTYQPTQASSSSSSPAQTPPQTPAKTAPQTPATSTWTPNFVASRHNTVVQQINNWGYCCKCVSKLEITQASSKLGDIAKIGLLALANLGLAFCDVAKGAFCMVKAIVVQVLCCYKKAAPAPGAPAQTTGAAAGSTPQASAQTAGATPASPTQAGGESSQQAPTQASGASPQASSQASSGSAQQAPAQANLGNVDGPNQALEHINGRLAAHGVIVTHLDTRLTAIETAFNNHIGINAKTLTGLTDSFNELSQNLGTVDNRGSGLARTQEALKAKLDQLEGVVNAKVLPFNPPQWEPRTADTSSSSTTSTSPATSSSSSSSTPSSSPALSAQPDVEALIAEIKKTPEGVKQLARMFSDLDKAAASATL